MKKSYLLSGMIGLGVMIATQAMIDPYRGIKGQYSIKEVETDKLARQKALARTPAHRMLDALILYDIPPYYYAMLKDEINWPAVFHILDSMKGIIDVNEYKTYELDSKNGETLLYIAVSKGDILAAKKLLEKYKANPNIGIDTPLSMACIRLNIPMINLLLKYGADPYKKDSRGQNIFEKINSSNYPPEEEEQFLRVKELFNRLKK